MLCSLMPVLLLTVDSITSKIWRFSVFGAKSSLLPEISTFSKDVRVAASIPAKVSRSKPDKSNSFRPVKPETVRDTGGIIAGSSLPFFL